MKRLEDKSDPRDGWYEITPDGAVKIEARAHPNRDKKENNVGRIVVAMTAGRFLPNGEPLIFCPEGRLLDGLNRIRAIIESGVTVVCYCVFGVSPAYFPSFDNGVVRSGVDTATVMGFSNPKAANEIAYYSARYEGLAGRWVYQLEAIDPVVRQRYLDQHRAEIEETCEMLDAAAPPKLARKVAA